VGDLDGDGKPDLVVANQYSNDATVLLGNGDGSFQAGVSYPAGAGPVFVTVADVNGDGKPDVFVVNQSDNNVSVLLGHDKGTLQPAVSYTYSTGGTALAVAVGDINRDGKQDLALTGDSGVTGDLLLGNGNGTFQDGVSFDSGERPFDILIGDFNGDGNADIATTFTCFACNVGYTRVLLGNGDGTFQTGLDYPLAEYASRFSATADLNADGKLDLAIPNGTQTVSVLLGNGDGTFKTAVHYVGLSGPTAVAIADFNLDGVPDLAAANDDNEASVLLGTGDGTFAAPVKFSVASPSWSLATGDFNGDGKPDLAVANVYDNSVSVLLNTTAQPNTQTGANIAVEPVDARTQTTPVTLSYSNVTRGGNTMLTTSGTGQAPPAGFRLGTPPTYYDLSTTALFSGTVSICVNYAGIAFNQQSNLHLFHYSGSAWVDITVNNDTINQIICGTATSFSPFIVAEPSYAAEVQQPINSDGSSIFNATKGVVPVKFNLTAGGPQTCTLPTASIAITRLSGSSPGTVDESIYTSSSDNGSYFRVSSCQYVYNLASKSLGAGSYRVDILMGNTVIGNGYFGLK
jgi:hypothetical protein